MGAKDEIFFEAVITKGSIMSKLECSQVPGSKTSNLQF